MSGTFQYELLAQDPERAVRFYRDVFGWKAEAWPGPWKTWLITAGPDANSSAGPGSATRPNPLGWGVNTVQVDSLEETSARVLAAGGLIIEPAFRLPGIGWYSLCADSEGNRFGLMQVDADDGGARPIPPPRDGIRPGGNPGPQ